MDMIVDDTILVRVYDGGSYLFHATEREMHDHAQPCTMAGNG